MDPRKPAATADNITPPVTPPTARGGYAGLASKDAWEEFVGLPQASKRFVINQIAGELRAGGQRGVEAATKTAAAMSPAMSRIVARQKVLAAWAEHDAELRAEMAIEAAEGEAMRVRVARAARVTGIPSPEVRRLLHAVDRARAEDQRAALSRLAATAQPPPIESSARGPSFRAGRKGKVSSSTAAFVTANKGKSLNPGVKSIDLVSLDPSRCQALVYLHPGDPQCRRKRPAGKRFCWTHSGMDCGPAIASILAGAKCD